MNEQAKEILRKHRKNKEQPEEGENSAPVKEVSIDMNADPFKTVFEVADRTMDILETFKKAYDSSFIVRVREALKEKARELEEFSKCLDAELKKPIYEGKDIDALFDEAEKDENGDPVESSLFIHALTAAEAARQAAGVLPELQSTGTPKYYTSPNTTLSNALQAIDGKGEVIGAGAMDIPVLNVRKEKEVTIYVDASLENMEGVEITGKPFTEYDRAVHDAIVSIFMDRQTSGKVPAATADMIYRTMTHKTSTETVSPQQKGAVTKSIEKMRKNIYVYADATEEMKVRKIVTNPNGKTDGEKYKFVLDDFMLSATHFDNMGVSGANVSGWIFNKPLLLSYAELTGQLFSVNGELLDIKKLDKNNQLTTVSIANSESRIAVKSYLLRRVEVMRKDEERARDAYRKYKGRRSKNTELKEKSISDFRKQRRVILFDTLFHATGISGRTEARTKDYVYTVLEYWKAKQYIKDFKKRKNGKAFDAVIIEI